MKKDGGSIKYIAFQSAVAQFLLLSSSTEL